MAPYRLAIFTEVALLRVERVSLTRYQFLVQVPDGRCIFRVHELTNDPAAHFFFAVPKHRLNCGVRLQNLPVNVTYAYSNGSAIEDRPEARLTLTQRRQNLFSRGEQCAQDRLLLGQDGVACVF